MLLMCATFVSGANNLKWFDGGPQLGRVCHTHCWVGIRMQGSTWMLSTTGKSHLLPLSVGLCGCCQQLTGKITLIVGSAFTCKSLHGCCQQQVKSNSLCVSRLSGCCQSQVKSHSLWGQLSHVRNSVVQLWTAVPVARVRFPVNMGSTFTCKTT